MWSDRTLLANNDDMAAFEAYSKNVSSTYLPQFLDLMQRSAAQAAAATSRPMEIADFTGDAVIQDSPTGRYGLYTILSIGKILQKRELI